MYRCKHHALHELLPKHIYKKYEAKGDLDSAWELLDQGMLKTLDTMREKFGIMYLNNWYWGGKRQWQVLRTPASPDYSETSQHSFGRAADPSFKLHTAQYIRDYIRANSQEFSHVTSMELGVFWVHFDTRNCVSIKLYRP